MRRAVLATRRELLVFASLGVLLELVSLGIQQELVEPQLPTNSSAVYNWTYVYLVMAACLYLGVGVRAGAVGRWVLLLAATALPWCVGLAAWGLATGRPVAHDTWVDDAAFWRMLFFRLSFYAILSIWGLLGGILWRSVASARTS